MPQPTRKADLIEAIDLGYLICRVIRTYGMGYEEVMSLPMPVFWELSGQVERIRADEARMLLQVGIALQTPENGQSMNEWLDKVAPGPFKLSGLGRMMSSAKPDEEGMSALRALAG